MFGMMVQSEINSIVKSGAAGSRCTTQDSCVGEIITKKGRCNESTYILPPRHIVWLVSKETYDLDETVTGITTLRTTWTKKGILTLTVGIVDPGWNGPLSTAVINFSSTDFYIEKGQPFFRTAFFRHPSVAGTNGYKRQVIDRDKYISDVQAEAGLFDDTFLTFNTLVPEVAKEIFKIPRFGAWAAWFAVGAAILGLLGAFTAPAIATAYGMAGEIAAKDERLKSLEQRITTLETDLMIGGASESSPQIDPSVATNSDGAVAAKDEPQPAPK